MKIFLKQSLRCIFAIVLFLAGGLMVDAATIDRHIYDDADLLTAEEEAELENLAEQLGFERDIVFVIITKEDGSDVEVYTDDFYDEISQGEPLDALILTVDMSVREYFFKGYYLADSLLTNQDFDRLENTLMNYLSSDDYFSAFYAFIEDAHDYMGVEPEYSGEEASSGRTEEENIFYQWWVQLIIAVFIATGVVGYMAYTSGGKVTVTEGMYRDHSASKIRARKDQYVRTVVTKKRRPKSNSSGGFRGGGGGSFKSRRGSF